LQDEFYSTAFRKTLYTSLEQLQTDLDHWLEDYNCGPYYPTSLCA
jgi:hypothetical protein